MTSERLLFRFFDVRGFFAECEGAIEISGDRIGVSRDRIGVLKDRIEPIASISHVGNEFAVF